ncbi:MAG: alpha/beta fold hydrolase, partial [Anaerolineae bacterium]
TKPLLLVWGMKDFAFTPGHYMPRWQAAFDDVTTVPLEDAKHFIQEDAPGAIARAIADRFG